MIQDTDFGSPTQASAEAVSGAAALLPLLIELNDWKRIRVADRPGSLATRMFRRAWARLVAGEPLLAVALEETAYAVAATRLAGIDARVLRAGGLDPADVLAVLQRGFDAVAGPLDRALAERLRATLSAEPRAEAGAVPPFVELLAAQPRAGATRPDHPRVVLEPPENHADHCATVAVYAVLAAPLFDADPGIAFLAGLAHHLHNARLPDAGYAGDELVGPLLQTLMRTFRNAAIEELPAALHAPVEDALSLVYRADTPPARAFQTADVLDRVLEMRWHAQTAAFTLDVALHEMDIVHPGPVQAFQQRLLRGVGLLPGAAL